MKRSILICTVVCLLAIFGVSLIQERRMARLTAAVQRLTQAVQALIEERDMADVNLTDGDPALNHGATATWTSGTQTVEITVYKNSANETSAEFRARYLDAVDKAMTQYPPNTSQ